MQEKRYTGHYSKKSPSDSGQSTLKFCLIRYLARDTLTVHVQCTSMTSDMRISSLKLLIVGDDKLKVSLMHACNSVMATKPKGEN